MADISGITMPAAIVDGAVFEALRSATDDIRLRSVAGDVQVTEYSSDDREGPPPHSHEWHEVEYVIEGEVEFFQRGAWTRCGPGSVQLLPAGEPHSVRIPEGTARVLMITIGAPYDGFARDLARLEADGNTDPAAVVEAAGRHGVRLGT